MKVFKSLNEQIEIMKNKSLIIDDEVMVKQKLLEHNYYVIKGYQTPFVEQNNPTTFYPNVYFEDIFALYEFDTDLKILMLDYILKTENKVKSVMAYFFSEKYGADEKEYLQMKNFSTKKYKQDEIKELFEDMNRKKHIRINKAVNHYVEKHNNVPLWVMIKVLNFNELSDFYYCLKKEDQQQVSNYFNIDNRHFQTILNRFVHFRNICAHGDICFNAEYQNKTYVNILESLLVFLPEKETKEMVRWYNDLVDVVLKNREFYLSKYIKKI